MAPRRRAAALTWLLAACAALRCAGAWPGQSWRRAGPLLVVGSVNLDTTARVSRLPALGETVTASDPNPSVALGGKGANQAVAAARLRGAGRPAARFACRLGGDAAGGWLRAQLEGAGVDASDCGAAPEGVASGQGLVLLDHDGAATSVVLGGANALGWPAADAPELAESAAALVAGAAALLLQREIPEHVNAAFARAARAAGLPVLLDAGGEDRDLSPALLDAVDFLCPNESELARLTRGAPTHTDAAAEAAARQLLAAGARAVLVTLGARGSMLLMREGRTDDANAAVTVLHQGAVPLPGGVLVDATAAGDAFRAAFAVALVEGRTPAECLRLGAAAGAAAAARRGAVPSLPTRAEVETLLFLAENTAAPPAAAEPAFCSAATEASPDAAADAHGATFPLRFASRLNSMHARRDLALAGEADTPLGWIARQGRVAGLGLVFLNHPQHTAGLAPADVAAALGAAKLQAGGIATRFPERFRAGAFTNPDAAMRDEALRLALDGCRWAAALNASELVVWSPYDGYDYHLQMDYNVAWARTVAAFASLADGCASYGSGVRVSVEWKPTDPASRFSVVPSTGAALLLAAQVGRPNFGVTLDAGHLLLGGENPAQAVALAAREGRLFGIQLSDAHSRLGAEDGLAFGAVNPVSALELIHYLRKSRYSGALYFDTFPSNEDPVAEAARNVARVKALWHRSVALDAAGLGAALAAQDALASLALLDAAMEGR